MRANLFLYGAAMLLTSGVVYLNASDLDTIGVTALRAVEPSLNGSGIYLNHPEGSESGTTQFEVDPSAVGQPASLFTWINDGATATTFPNSLGTKSDHAVGMATRLYSVNEGVVPKVSHVDNYLAWPFYSNVIAAGVAISGHIVNQSFATYGSPPDTVVGAAYDSYVARYGTIFSSGTGSGQAVRMPAAAYNVIGVGVSDATSSVNGTPDGRAKPDLSAPGLSTSASTTYVTGAAAMLLQAIARGDAGTNVSAASDARTMKALLMNGAAKPINWTHSTTMPVDATHGTGAGVLNVFISYRQMIGGQHRAIETTSVNTGSAHPPGSNHTNETVLSGWDFATITTTSTHDTVAHYYFNLPDDGGNYGLAASLAWNRQLNQTSINNLDLFLYQTSDGALVAQSVSAVDNIEHIYMPSLPAGRYDLQVLKHGGPNVVSDSETYALAFDIPGVVLTIDYYSGGVVLTWPVGNMGYTLEMTSSLSPEAWNVVSVAPVVSNNMYRVSISSSPGHSDFFRLRR
jgi:hypothetical protein